MKFLCTTDCFSNKICMGFRAGNLYELNVEQMTAMGTIDGQPGHFPRRFEPADPEASAYLQKLNEPPMVDVSKEDEPVIEEKPKDEEIADVSVTENTVTENVTAEAEPKKTKKKTAEE